MNIFKSEHSTNDKVIIRFKESWFSDEYYEVHWKWAKPSSLEEKIFGCPFHTVLKYDDLKFYPYNNRFQWSEKTYHLDIDFVNLKHWADNKEFTYQEMADYFGITESERLYEEAKKKAIGKEIENEKLRKLL